MNSAKERVINSDRLKKMEADELAEELDISISHAHRLRRLVGVARPKGERKERPEGWISPYNRKRPPFSKNTKLLCRRIRAWKRPEGMDALLTEIRDARKNKPAKQVAA